MLLSLHVRNFAIIDEAEIEFSDGLNILTGETGAGKSILIGSISAALGGKVAKDSIGRNADHAYVELSFEVSDKEVLSRIEQMDFFPEEGTFTISRKVLATGRSILKINGEAATAAEVKEVALLLLNVHGQNEHQSLLASKKQLELVDEFASERIKPVKEEVEESYRSYRELLSERENAVTNSDRRLREMDYLRFSIDEIERAGLKEGEEETLRASFKKLSGMRLIEEALSETKEYIGEDEGCLSLLGRAIKRLSKAVELDDSLQGNLDTLMDAESLVTDLNRDIAAYLDDSENSEEELERIRERIDLIDRLKGKYGDSVEAILEKKRECEKELERFEDYESYLTGLEKKLSEARARLEKNSAALTKLREDSSSRLSALVRASMEDLNFGQSLFEIRLMRLDDFTANGIETAEIVVSLNPGEPMLPLRGVASGGELSRIMLAIKSVFAGVRDTGTLIFDEIDAGISGRTAAKVAEKLAVISSDKQIICITHLPQIAAMADTHFVIEKEVQESSTRTSIRKLLKNEMIEELARLTGGSTITESVRAGAAELKSLANEQKHKLKE